MEIKIGDYTLKSDKFCMHLEKSGTRVTGYCRSFDKLLDDFIDKGIKDSDVKSVEEALSVLCQATRDAKRISKEAAEKNFRIVRHKESEGK